MSSTFPTSNLFEVRATPNAGRGLFATQSLAADTPLLSTSAFLVTVILRKYRKEVCAWCFAYERGRNLNIRDAVTNSSFCSQGCSVQWRDFEGETGVEAWIAVETFI